MFLALTRKIFKFLSIFDIRDAYFHLVECVQNVQLRHCYTESRTNRFNWSSRFERNNQHRPEGCFIKGCPRDYTQEVFLINTNLVNPLIMLTYRSMTMSSQPHRRGLPVVTPNSAPLVLSSSSNSCNEE